MKRILSILALLPFISGCRSIVKDVTDGIIGAWSYIPLVLIGGCLAGCTITTKNQGEMGFRYGTEVTFFHRAAQTAPEPATIQSDAPALIDWLVKPKEPEVEVVVPAEDFTKATP